MHLKKLGLLRLLAFFSTVFIPPFLQAGQFDIPKVISIQKRAYNLSDEVTGQFSYLPMDSFTNYFTLGGAFTHYFNDFLGWEALNLEYANSYSTGLTGLLNTKYQVQTEPFDIINYYGTTNLVYTPMYMKNLLFNSGIVYGEISFVGGLGITKFNTSGNVSTVDFGMIMRYFLSKSTSLKFDFREYVYLSGTSKSNLALTGGFAYDFGWSDNKAPMPDEDE